jgi:plastocyanin
MTSGSRREVWFDPIGFYVQPGATVRWSARENVHTTTGYHPNNDRHSLLLAQHSRVSSGFLPSGSYIRAERRGETQCRAGGDQGRLVSGDNYEE